MLVGQLRDWNRQHGHGKVLESSIGVSIGLNGAPDAGWLSGERDRTIPKEERSKLLSIAVFELMSPNDTAPAIAKRANEWVAADVTFAVVLDPSRRVAIPHDKNGTGWPVSEALRIAKALLTGADADLIIDLAAIFDAG